jgi:aerobic carbon-monoxide dehydrogenase small subunit
MAEYRDSTEPPNVGISFKVNGQKVDLEVKPWDTALSVLRDQMGLTGTKEGCGIGECGACTIIVDGHAVNACLMAAPQLDGRDVETVEGLAAGGSFHELQQAFLAHGAVQCGFCTPGMLLSAKALIDRAESPDRDEIVEALSGNLCRCTGYEQILEAVQDVLTKSEKA